MKNMFGKLIISIILIMVINVMPVYAADTFYWNGIEVQD